MIKGKVLEIFRYSYTKFKSLSRPKQIAIGIGAILIILLVSKSNDRNSSRSELNSSSGSQTISNSKQRKANLNLALSNKALKLPYKIGDLTITKMSADRSFIYLPKNGTNKKISWNVDIKNETKSEISAVINICDSYSTAVGNFRLEQSYLADCNPLELRMNPSSISKNNTFAVSNAWFYRGDTLQICIQGQGCYEHTFIDKPL
tara:strand:+ start:31 stop:642 length:612 start_codon:yes stop_codon:yes gene_type:complete